METTPSLSRRWKEGPPSLSPLLFPSSQATLPIPNEGSSDVQLIPGLPNRLLPSSQTRFGNSAHSQSGLPFHPFRRSLALPAPNRERVLLYPPAAAGPQIVRFRIDLLDRAVQRELPDNESATGSTKIYLFP